MKRIEVRRRWDAAAAEEMALCLGEEDPVRPMAKSLLPSFNGCFALVRLPASSLSQDFCFPLRAIEDMSGDE